jgi:hypothetical protein
MFLKHRHKVLWVNSVSGNYFRGYSMIKVMPRKTMDAG